MSQPDFITHNHGTSYEYISPLQHDLAGKHVLITGAAWHDGVGAATATAYARAGASVIAICDIHEISGDIEARLLSAAADAGRAKPVIVTGRVDISNLLSVQALHDRLLSKLDGRLDILVNNAAVMEPLGTFLDVDPNVYWQTWETNIRGLFNMTRTFLPMLLSTRGLCTVVNVASSGALSPRPLSSGYRTSKLAILRWTENTQLDFADSGLLMYCVNPGAIKTQITVAQPDAVRNMLPHQPEIAGDTIVWLSAERKEWLAGRYVSCPWDMAELVARKEEIVEGDKLKLRIVY